MGRSGLIFWLSQEDSDCLSQGLYSLAVYKQACGDGHLLYRQNAKLMGAQQEKN